VTGTIRRPGVAPLTAITLALALTVSACGAAASGELPDRGRTVRIEMSDFAFAPPQIVLQAGETVTFIFSNFGTVEHEFMAGTGPTAGHGYVKDWFASVKASGLTHDSEHMGMSVRVAPRGTARLRFAVPNEVGQFDLGCFVASHYEDGMRGVLVVVSNEPTTSPRVVPTALPGAVPTPSGSPGEMEMEAH
jgi:uncharacterized cupredoxin-like copper-binding protein